MEILICMGNILAGRLSNILRFTNSVLIPMMNITTSKFTVVFSMQLPLRIIITILSYLELFKYHNVKFNLNKVTKIHSSPYLVGYLMASLNRYS